MGDLDRSILKDFDPEATVGLALAVARQNRVREGRVGRRVKAELNFQRAPRHLKGRIDKDLYKVIHPVKNRAPINRSRTIEVESILRTILKRTIDSIWWRVVQIVQRENWHL